MAEPSISIYKKQIMKKAVPALLFLLSLHIYSFGQTQYEVISEAGGSKILKGIIAKENLTNDTNYIKWYAENLKGYIPNNDAVAALKKNTSNIQLVVFMGTWCDDSKNIVPKFYSLLSAAGFPESRVSLIGVDRSKKTISHLTEAFNIINVPTIMVMKDGKEAGRVVEYGKYGLFDKELAEIINAVK
jgi:thiol-disulfide isomerase/thioredoxin